MTTTIDLSTARENKRSQEEQTSPTQPEHCPAWTGDLDTHLLKGQLKGEPLFAALQNRARQLGHSIQDMCGQLDFSYPYYSQLRSGRRSLSGAADSFSIACAKYLGIPRLTVLALAGIVTPEDMYQSRDAITANLPRAFEYVCNDADWANLCTVAVRSSHPETQYLMVRLYEKMAGLQLLPSIVDADHLASGMAALQAIQANLNRKAPSTQSGHL